LKSQDLLQLLIQQVLLTLTMVEELIRVIRTLRRSCPWDKQQTVDSIRPLLLNEVYELDEALRKNNPVAIVEELGDYLFMGFFLAQILREERAIELKSILNRVVKKLKYRHPHVYGKIKVKDVDEVLNNWEKLKRVFFPKSIVAGIPLALPALQQAQLIQERCRRVGFDWSSAIAVLSKVEEELTELKREMTKYREGREKTNKRVKEELGDLLFAIVNLSRHLEVNAEGALKDAIVKFKKRFVRIEREFARQGRELSSVGLDEMEKVWEKTKNKRTF